METKREEYKGTHERLIDETIFYKCQAILRRNNRGENISLSRPADAFPLKHFVVCAFCGRPLTAYFSTGRWGGRFPYYRCYNKNCASKKSVAKKKLEEDFLLYLQGIKHTDRFTRAFKATILDVWENEYKRINRDRKSQIEKIEDLKEEKTKLIEMKKKELLPDDDFKEAFDRLKSEIDIKESGLSETKLEEFNLDEAVDYVFDYIRTLPSNWQEASYEQKIKLQGLIFAEKPVYDNEKFQTPKLSPILAIKKELALTNSSLVDYCIENLHPLVLDIKRWFNVINSLKIVYTDLST